MLNFMKRMVVPLNMLINTAGLTADEKDSANTFNISVQDTPKKIYDDIGTENIYYVYISGNAKFIVIRKNVNKYFVFHSGDLNIACTY